MDVREWLASSRRCLGTLGMDASTKCACNGTTQPRTYDVSLKHDWQRPTHLLTVTFPAESSISDNQTVSINTCQDYAIHTLRWSHAQERLKHLSRCCNARVYLSLDRGVRVELPLFATIQDDSIYQSPLTAAHLPIFDTSSSCQ